MVPAQKTESGVLFHCHNSRVYTEPWGYYLLESNLKENGYKIIRI